MISRFQAFAFKFKLYRYAPGRLLTCANDEPYLDLSGVTTLVIDEADQMLDMGFEPQVGIGTFHHHVIIL